MSRPIELTDVGPIERLVIPVPDGGGVVLLRGQNGSGKTHALQAVQTLVDGSGKIPSRDGSIGAQVSGCGVRITIGRRVTASGELEVAHLEGEDPSVLVEPNIKSPDAADGARIKALLRISRATVGPEAFAPLVGGDKALREMCPEAALEMVNDVPGMAAAIKRAIEGAARKAEQMAETLKAKAAGMRATLDEMGGGAAVLLVSGSAEQAREAHTAAVRAHSAREAERKQNAQLLRSSIEAQGALKTLGDDGTEAAIAAAQASAELADEDAKAKQAEVERIKEALAAAQSAWSGARDHVLRCAEETTRQNRASTQRAQLCRAIEAAAGATEITDAELAGLATKVDEASAELSRWAVRDKTSKARAEVAELEQQGLVAEESGAELRSAAKGTERVVLDAVKSVCPEGMELTEGRLYMNTNRGRELFSELSAGERWRISLDIACKAVGPNGLLSVRQEAWEGLDPANRRALAAHAKAIGVVIVTAEAADGEIRAEVFEPAEAAAS